MVGFWQLQARQSRADKKKGRPTLASELSQEVKRGLVESLGLKLWWVLATLAQARSRGEEKCIEDLQIFCTPTPTGGDHHLRPCFETWRSWGLVALAMIARNSDVYVLPVRADTAGLRSSGAPTMRGSHVGGAGQISDLRVTGYSFLRISWLAIACSYLLPISRKE